MTDYILIILSILLLFLAILIVQCRNLLSAVILMSAFSITLAACFVMVSALDVAITEAVVGGGFVTALYLVTLSKTRDVQ